jgi:hypothetical protein
VHKYKLPNPNKLKQQARSEALPLSLEKIILSIDPKKPLS